MYVATDGTLGAREIVEHTPYAAARRMVAVVIESPVQGHYYPSRDGTTVRLLVVPLPADYQPRTT